jgi:uncharacterized Zn-binding protein involved in type VI secretion
MVDLYETGFLAPILALADRRTKNALLNVHNLATRGFELVQEGSVELLGTIRPYRMLSFGGSASYEGDSQLKTRLDRFPVVALGHAVVSPLDPFDTDGIKEIEGVIQINGSYGAIPAEFVRAMAGERYVERFMISDPRKKA